MGGLSVPSAISTWAASVRVTVSRGQLSTTSLVWFGSRKQSLRVGEQLAAAQHDELVQLESQQEPSKRVLGGSWNSMA